MVGALLCGGRILTSLLMYMLSIVEEFVLFDSMHLSGNC